jgi:uncharacterized protein
MNEQLPTSDPIVSDETRPFWDGAAEGRLLLPRCQSCGHHVWYPRAHCTACHSSDLDWVELSGRGRIYSFSVVHRARGEWADHVPYVVAYVELDEGPRLLTNLVTDEPDALEIDQRVEVAFHRAPSGGAVIRFVPAGDI